jgi:hypothetical protein
MLGYCFKKPVAPTIRLILTTHLQTDREMESMHKIIEKHYSDLFLIHPTRVWNGKNENLPDIARIPHKYF